MSKEFYFQLVMSLLFCAYLLGLFNLFIDAVNWIAK